MPTLDDVLGAAESDNLTEKEKNYLIAGLEAALVVHRKNDEGLAAFLGEIVRKLKKIL